jgi:hypothetical protein
MIDDASENLYAVQVLQCYFDVWTVQGLLGQDYVKRDDAIGTVHMCVQADVNANRQSYCLVISWCEEGR